MATFFYLYNCFSLIFILQLLFLSLQTNGAAVDDICNQTKDPYLCLQGFGADVRRVEHHRRHDVAGAVDVGLTAATQTALDIYDRLVNEKDRNLKNIYLKCPTFYYHIDSCLGVMMINDLHRSQGNYADYKKQAEVIRGDVGGVEALFNNNSPFASEDKPFGILADAMVLIAHALMSH